MASGDPLTDRVVIWTRYTPSPATPAPQETPVTWQVATDPGFSDVVATGIATAGADRDHTVKVDVAGLSPGSRYHYRFSTGADEGEVSPTGATRTAPDGEASSLRLGLVSCASWANGYFNAYANLAEHNLDLVVHVGDYIYEGSHRAGRPVRAVPRPDPASRLDDYRRRYALYRTDPDVQAMHARLPMAAVWDDHELSSGAWRDGASGHHPRRDGEWAQRRAAAVSAYLDWMPLRVPDGNDDEPDRIYRRLGWGSLADVFMLDTRLVGRDQPAGDGRIVWGPGRRPRSLLGEPQRRWLETEVSRSTARWRVFGNQVMMAPAAVLGGHVVNPDQWDGYPQERAWLYDALGDAGNAVVLSGDLHSSWASDLPVGAEFVAPSVTARSFANSLLGSSRWAGWAQQWLRRQNRHLHMVELSRHGYVVVDIDADRVQADFWHLDTVRRRSRSEVWGGGWQLRHGRPGLVPASSPVAESGREQGAALR